MWRVLLSLFSFTIPDTVNSHVPPRPAPPRPALAPCAIPLPPGGGRGAGAAAGRHAHRLRRGRERRPVLRPGTSAGEDPPHRLKTRQPPALPSRRVGVYVCVQLLLVPFKDTPLDTGSASAAASASDDDADELEALLPVLHACLGPQPADDTPAETARRLRALQTVWGRALADEVERVAQEQGSDGALTKWFQVGVFAHMPMPPVVTARHVPLVEQSLTNRTSIPTLVCTVRSHGWPGSRRRRRKPSGAWKPRPTPFCCSSKPASRVVD